MRTFYAKKTTGHNTWFKKLGLIPKTQASFPIFRLFLTWDKEVAVYSPTFFNHENVTANFKTDYVKTPIKKRMKKSNQIKKWRLNIFAIYFGDEMVNSYRFYILELLKNLASIYKLDYSISIDHKFPSVDNTLKDIDYKSTCDLIYIRSNEYSRIKRKEFRKAIDSVFCKVPSPFYGGVDIGTQLYKALKEYPFPKDFYRPLDYPWIERHEGSKKKLFVYADEVIKVIEREQDYLMN